MSENSNLMHQKIRLITNNQSLAEACDSLQTKTKIAVDTEFVRTRSYYPKLGLIQLYAGDDIYIVDPVEVTDLTPIANILADKNIIKILHACSEDLEVFEHHLHQLPVNMVDTQVIASFTGFGMSVGFNRLIQHYFNLELDKGLSYRQWLTRPLTERQIAYAAADVYYLLPLYAELEKKLATTNWQNAVQQECNSLIQKRSLLLPAQDAYLSISNAWKLSAPELAVLKPLASWRMQEAIKRDLAINFVLKENNMWKIAKSNPQNISALLELGLEDNEVRYHGKQILNLVQKGLQSPPESLPKVIENISKYPEYAAKMRQLQQKLQTIRPEEIPVELIASKRHLHKLIQWHWVENNSGLLLPEVLVGWREEYGIQLQQELIKV